MRQPILEAGPDWRRRRDIVREVKAPVRAREDLFRVSRIRDDRIHRNVRKISCLICPGERSAAGVANNAIDMAGSRRRVRIETADRGIGRWRAGRRRIESNVEDGPVW